MLTPTGLQPISETIEVQDTRQVRAQSETSARSETTNITSHSALELREMISDDMIANIPDLVAKSERVLNFLAPSDFGGSDIDILFGDLKDPKSQIKLGLGRAEKAFQNVKKIYGSDPYIHVPLAVRKIFDVKSPGEAGDGPWRPDDAFYMANLSTLLLDFIHAALAEGKEFPLEGLDRNFPEAFVSRIRDQGRPASAGCSSLVQETFDLALAIRTQLTVQAICDHQDDESFDRKRFVRQTLLNQTEESEFRDWAFVDPNAPEYQKMQAHVMDTVNAIEAVCDADTNDLTTEYPMGDFLLKLLGWSRKRCDELSKRLDSGETLQETLDAELQRRKSITEPTAELQGPPSRYFA